MFLFLFVYLSSSITYATTDNGTCIIGSPIRNELLNDFNKPNLNPDTDSFLQAYRKHKERISLRPLLQTDPLDLPLKRKNSQTEATVCVDCGEPAPKRRTLIRNLQNNIRSSNTIPKECIDIAIKRVPRISGPKRRYCPSNTSSPQNLSGHPCITTDLTDYIAFTINKAIDCLSPENDPIDAHAIFGKINNESGFGFYNSSLNGIGLMQITTAGARESSGKMANNRTDSLGKRFIDNVVATNPKCEDFRRLRQTPLQLSSGAARICQFVSLGDGLARSALNGIGLYLYYRQQHPLSAERILARMGITKDNPDYGKIRSYVTLAMYSRHGPNASTRAAFYSFDYKIKDPSKITHEEFYRLATSTGRLNYLKEIERRYQDMQQYTDANNNCPFNSILKGNS